MGVVVCFYTGVLQNWIGVVKGDELWAGEGLLVRPHVNELLGESVQLERNVVPTCRTAQNTHTQELFRI